MNLDGDPHLMVNIPHTCDGMDNVNQDSHGDGVRFEADYDRKRFYPRSDTGTW